MSLPDVSEDPNELRPGAVPCRAVRTGGPGAIYLDVWKAAFAAGTKPLAQSWLTRERSVASG